MEHFLVAGYESLDKLLRNDHRQHVERKVAVEVQAQSARPIQEANVGIARLPYHLFGVAVARKDVLGAGATQGNREHHGRSHLVKHRKLRIVCFALKVLVHDAKPVVMPLLERSFHRCRRDMVVTLNAVVVCKQQTFGMVNTIGHLSFVCNLSVYHS